MFSLVDCLPLIVGGSSCWCSRVSSYTGEGGKEREEEGERGGEEKERECVFGGGGE